MHHIQSALSELSTEIVHGEISLANQSGPETLSALLISNELFTSFYFSSAENLETSFMLG